MSPPLDVAKVLYGAFAVPWWHRREFARALFVPLLLLVALGLGSHYTDKHAQVLRWLLLSVGYAVLTVWFAVTCHRLVLLDPASTAARMLPPWSRRETRFFVWTLATGAIFIGILMSVSLALGMAVTAATGATVHSGGLYGTLIPMLAMIPAYYVLSRLSIVFPATAVDRNVDLGWSWRLTRGNGWRLFVVVGVLPLITSGSIDLLSRRDAGAAETVILTFLGTAVLAIEIAALSLSYRELTREEPTP